MLDGEQMNTQIKSLGQFEMIIINKESIYV